MIRMGVKIALLLAVVAGIVYLASLVDVQACLDVWNRAFGNVVQAHDALTSAADGVSGGLGLSSGS